MSSTNRHILNGPTEDFNDDHQISNSKNKIEELCNKHNESWEQSVNVTVCEMVEPNVDDALNQEEKDIKGELEADILRFAVLPIFCLLSLTNAMQWITFSPIVDEVKQYFHVNSFQVNFLASINMLIYIVIVFLSCKLYEITGIKMGLLIAATTNVTVATLKIIALYKYPHAALLFLAQAFNALTEVLTIATPPLISNRWFPEKERTVANTVMSVALNFGCGVGVLFPTFFVGPNNHEKRHFAHLFWFHFGLSAAALLLMIFVFPKKPRTSASYAAACLQNREEARLKAFDRYMQGSSNNESKPNDSNEAIHSDNDEREQNRKTENRTIDNYYGNANANMFDCNNEDEANANGHRRNEANTSANDVTPNVGNQVKESEDTEVVKINIFSVLVDCYREGRHNLSFVLLSLTSAAELGLIWAFATILPQLLSPYGVSEATAGWIGFLNFFLGTVVCPLFMPFVERFGRRYKQILCTMSVILVVSMIVLTLLLHYGPDAKNNKNIKYYAVVTFLLWGGVAGLCQNFMMPLMFEFVVELTFPMAESTSAPVLTWTACLTNFVLALGFGAVLTDNPDEKRSLRVFIGATIVTAIGSIAIFFTKSLRKRTDYESAKKEEHLRLLGCGNDVEEEVVCNNPDNIIE